MYTDVDQTIILPNTSFSFKMKLRFLTKKTQQVKAEVLCSGLVCEIKVRVGGSQTPPRFDETAIQNEKLEADPIEW